MLFCTIGEDLFAVNEKTKGVGARCMPIGDCPMCLGKMKQIGCSHLMPASLYETCRAEDSEPIKVSDQIVMETSRQTQDYLLCVGNGSCEERLNLGGEAWTLPMLMKKDRSFPLYDVLRRYSLDVDEEDVKAYLASGIPEIDVKKLAHFAMGIFWKASVHSWKKEKGDPRIKLGPYSGVLRRYLMGETEFPQHVSLTVNVSPPARAPILFTDPVTGKDKHSHFVYVPGIQFCLMVGRTHTEEIKEHCFAKHPEHPIMIWDGLLTQFEDKLKRQFLKAPKSRRYMEAKKLRDAQRLGDLQGGNV
jgi:hypothetical protein